MTPWQVGAYAARIMRRFLATGIMGALVLSGGATAPAEGRLPSGSYRVAYWLELPHVERWAMRKEAQVCLSGGGAGAMAFPVLSANTPFAACAVAEWRERQGHVLYRVACKGRDAARATADFRLTRDGFEGRIAMVMGAKNMTMTEVQVARRTGACAQASRSTE